MDRAFYSPSTPTGSVFCHLTCWLLLHQLCPLIMEKILVLLLVTLAVAYAVPDPRGIIVNLVGGSSGWGFRRGSWPLGSHLGLPGWEVRRLLPLPVPCPAPPPRGPREADRGAHAQSSGSAWLRGVAN